MTAQPTRDQLLDQLDQQEAIIRRQERYIEELENTDAVGLKARATQAEARIKRLEAQTDIRGRAVAIYQQRAREAEAERDRWHSMWRQRGVKHLAAEKRATRAEAERDEWREASVKLAASSNQANADLYEAEARIKAVQDLIDQADTAGDWTVTCSRLQWAIDGTNPYEETP